MLAAAQRAVRPSADADEERPSKNDQQEETCRICLEGSENEPLIRPCGCRGTVQWVHRTCIEHWLQQRPWRLDAPMLGNSAIQVQGPVCDLCRESFTVQQSGRKLQALGSLARQIVNYCKEKSMSVEGRDEIVTSCLGASLGVVLLCLFMMIPIAM